MNFSGTAHFYIRPSGFLTVKLTLFPFISWSLTCTNKEASETCSWPVKEPGVIVIFAFSPSPRECDQSKSSGCFSVTLLISDCPHFFTSNPTVNLWPPDSATHVTLQHWLLKTHLTVESGSCSSWETLGMKFTAEHCFGWLSTAVWNKKKKNNQMIRIHYQLLLVIGLKKETHFFGAHEETMKKLWNLHSQKRFLIKCCLTKTKLITLANHTGTHNPVNQSNLKLKGVVGWKSGASYLSQSCGMVDPKLTTFWHSHESCSIVHNKLLHVQKVCAKN